MNNYLVIRIANKPDGSTAAPVQVFEDGVKAEKEYYRLCGLAVDSVNITDAVSLLTTRGEVMMQKCFFHQEEPEESEENEGG